MRKKIVELLRCPNNLKSGFRLYGIRALRGADMIHSTDHDELLENDDVVDGLLISESSRTAYPVSEHIGIVLADHDVDSSQHLTLLEEFHGLCLEKYRPILDGTLVRLRNQKVTSDGKWNREEMRYYDADVETQALRDKMLESIRTKSWLKVLPPRRQYITEVIKGDCSNEMVLEIGCGNSRTISNVMRPAENGYDYIGTDISFKRLMVAKSAIPEGDFIQASALNLPFREQTFISILSFGMLHHLPRPVEAVKNSVALIKNGGTFCFHEPICKPEIRLPGVNLFKKLTGTYKHSEHDGKIELDEVMEVFRIAGFKKRSLKYQISIFRSVAESVLCKILGEKRAIIGFLAAADELALGTVGKISRRLGPSAVLVVMESSSLSSKSHI